MPFLWIHFIIQYTSYLRGIKIGDWFYQKKDYWLPLAGHVPG